MFDALDEPSDLSLALQKADINLATANKLISKQIKIFSARKETVSDYLSEANCAIAADSFKWVAISSKSDR
jgi:transcription antitermination factor NusA-like protein